MEILYHKKIKCEFLAGETRWQVEMYTDAWSHTYANTFTHREVETPDLVFESVVMNRKG